MVVTSSDRSDKTEKVGDALPRRAPPCPLSEPEIDDAFSKFSLSNASFYELSETILYKLYGAAETGLCRDVNRVLNFAAERQAVCIFFCQSPLLHLHYHYQILFLRIRRLVCNRGKCPTWRVSEGRQSKW